jgi:TRAP-type mannitol/chloroaromatic compound transport system substrate-binding protein
MERRKFIGTAGLAGILATGMAPAVHAGQAIRWRLASRFPKVRDILHDGVQEFTQTLKELSGGKFEITIFNANELPAASGVLDGVQRGTIECGHTAASYYLDRDETFALDHAIPFGLNAHQMNAWMQEGNGLNLLREFYHGHGVVNFPMGNTGAQMGGWYRKPIRSVADFKNLKIRITGLGAQVLKRLGALPSSLPAGEIYKALESGRIDAAEWSGPHDDLKLGLDRVAKYYAYPGWWKGGAQLSLYVNQRAYDSLTNDNKAILEAASATAHLGIQARYDAFNPPALRELVAAGAQLMPFPQSVLDAAHKTAMALYAELDGKNPAWKKIRASQAQFLRDQAWSSGYTDLAFMNYMNQKALDQERQEKQKKSAPAGRH